MESLPTAYPATPNANSAKSSRFIVPYEISYWTCSVTLGDVLPHDNMTVLYCSIQSGLHELRTQPILYSVLNTFLLLFIL